MRNLVQMQSFITILMQTHGNTISKPTCSQPFFLQRTGHGYNLCKSSAPSIHFSVKLGKFTCRVSNVRQFAMESYTTLQIKL